MSVRQQYLCRRFITVGDVSSWQLRREFGCSWTAAGDTVSINFVAVTPRDFIADEAATGRRGPRYGTGQSTGAEAQYCTIRRKVGYGSLAPKRQ